MHVFTPLLDRVESPADLKSLNRAELKELAHELRSFILHSVAKTGGHLSSNLGTVELTVALHYLLNTPEDRIVWDVGHQTYAHKILTGRKAGMASLRQYQGLSGFPKRSESEYDAFGTAHSSTSISAALGMAVAAQQLGLSRKCIAVIGDGAMTAGMAFEALNNAGDMKNTDILVILNDNDMSISPPVGALNQYLTRIMSGSAAETVRSMGKAILSSVPPVLEMARKLEEHAKGMVTPATLFEELGFHYYGPIDGHNLDVLLPTLQNILTQKGPRFLHVITKKGQGYDRAEADPILYHGPGKFDPNVGIQSTKAPQKTYTQIFGDWVCDMATEDSRLIAITPAMREGSGLLRFHQTFPERYFDVGIAEQHAVTFAAGIACEGLKPVVAIYSTFLQRAYDQLIHDVALQNLDVTFAIDRAGLVGADGATHAGNYDIAFMRCIPNMVIATPSDENECRTLLSTCYVHPGPSAVRYPRGTGSGKSVDVTLSTVPIGRAIVRRKGKRLAILCFGTYLTIALQVAEHCDCTVVDMRFVKPLDIDIITSLAPTVDGFITLEDGSVMGGAGSAVLEFLHTAGLSTPVLQLGYSDTFIDQGDVSQLLVEQQLTPEAILQKIQQKWQ